MPAHMNRVTVAYDQEESHIHDESFKHHLINAIDKAIFRLVFESKYANELQTFIRKNNISALDPENILNTSKLPTPLDQVQALREEFNNNGDLISLLQSLRDLFNDTRHRNDDTQLPPTAIYADIDENTERKLSTFKTLLNAELTYEKIGNREHALSFFGTEAMNQSKGTRAMREDTLSILIDLYERNLSSSTTVKTV